MYFRIVIWLSFVLLFTVSANTGSESLKLIKLDLTQKITCFTDENFEQIDIEPPVKGVNQLTIRDLLVEQAPTERFVSCEAVDNVFYCDWTAFKGVQIELQHVWQEQDSRVPYKLHVRGLWMKGLHQKPEPIFCNQDYDVEKNN